MLPGTRAYSDADVTEMMQEALAVFGGIVEEYDPPADLRPLVFQSVLNLVAQRTVVTPAGGGLEGIFRGGGH